MAYTTGKFRDNVKTSIEKKDVFIPNYECEECDYATIDLDGMKAHQIEGTHPYKTTAHTMKAAAETAKKENS